MDHPPPGSGREKKNERRRSKKGRRWKESRKGTGRTEKNACPLLRSCSPRLNPPLSSPLLEHSVVCSSLQTDVLTPGDWRALWSQEHLVAHSRKGANSRTTEVVQTWASYYLIIRTPTGPSNGGGECL